MAPERISVKPDTDIDDGFGADQLEHISLRERMLMLLQKKIPGSADLLTSVLGRESKRIRLSPVDNFLKGEDDNCHSQGMHHSTCVDELKRCSSNTEQFSEERNYAKTVGKDNAEVSNSGILVKSTVPLCFQLPSGHQYEDLFGDESKENHENNDVYSNQMEPPEVKANVFGLKDININVHNVAEYATLKALPAKLNVEYDDNDVMYASRDVINGSAHTDVQAVQIKSEILGDFGNERHKMLPSSQSLISSESVEISSHKEGNCCNIMKEVDHQGAGLKTVVLALAARASSGTFMHCRRQRGKQGVGLVKEEPIEESLVAEGCRPERSPFVCQVPMFDSCGVMTGGSCSIRPSSLISSSCQESVSSDSGNLQGIQENDSRYSSEKISTKSNECGGQEFVNINPNSKRGSTLSTFHVSVKEEIFENDLQRQCKNALSRFPYDTVSTVKNEIEFTSASCGDELDHMTLRERINLLKVSNLDVSRNLECLKKSVPSVEVLPDVSEGARPRVVIRTRKRKKTATDSVETALDEDAPGLLQVLIERGITVDEIKLYGDTESDDALDISSNEDSFAELEAVISKLFFQRPSLLKFSTIRCKKESRASYCLACLISLVEQTRYLQFRKWPVEWGWCRDLQSFIFVFERHNRIVLERPEYGYATYFFELVDTLPIVWQIKRLVTAMKLTGCSRVTLLENKPLLVGEDLTRGEAQVLEEYGWTPNTGLGSMLNYCDRVVHDRRNENDGSEWRSKIGKLLTDGYNGGTLVLANFPKKVTEYKDSQSQQIKLEV